MAIVPETRAERIRFYEMRLPRWAEGPAGIGVTPEAVATLAGLVGEAREAYDAHLRALEASRAATATYHEKVRRMHAGPGGGAALIGAIKAFAASTGDPQVYVRAAITPPATPGRPGSVAAPGTPHGFAVRLFQTGEVELTWKCDNPKGAVGTIYHVRRRIDGAGPFTLVGACGGEKRFLDDTLPAGTRGCEYEVTALRSTRRGEPARYSVQFGGALRLPSVQGTGKGLAA